MTTGLVMGVIALVAGLFNLPGAIPAYLVSAAAALFCGGLIWAATRQQNHRSNIADVSAFVFLAWVTTPFFALPALSQLLPGLDASGLLFEAFSAFTTTGAVLVSPEEAGAPVVLLRCALSFLGGYGTVLFAAGLLAAFDQSGPRMRKSVLLTHDPDNVFSNLGLAARRVFYVYGAVAFAAFLLLAMVGTDPFHALCLALSGMSTGGFAPRSGAMGEYIPDAGVFIMAMLCVAGSLNIAYLRNLTSKMERKSDPDLTGLLVLILGTFALFLVAARFEASWFGTLAEAIFAATTAGFHATDTAGYAPLTAIFAALAGGAAASTAGGLKISRLVLLWNQTFAELARLADPSSVISLKFRGGDTGNAALVALWSTVLAFIATMALAMLALAVLGAPLAQAWTGAATALSNSGPLYERMGDGFTWSQFGPASQIVLVIVMVLGRLEVLAGAAAVIALVRRD